MPELRAICIGCILILCGIGGTLSADDEPAGPKALTVTPRAIEEPRFQYRLFPDDAERHDANAAVLIQRMWADQPLAMQYLQDNARRHLEVPFEMFAIVPDSAKRESPLLPLEEMRRAAFCRHSDWDYPIDGSVPLSSIIIGDAAEASHVLQGLAVHCRADIVEGNIAAALDKITIGLGCTAHLQTPPFAIVKLIRSRDCDFFFDRIEELIQHADAPNLYWALTAVPDNLIEIETLPDWVRHEPWHHIEELADLGEERSAKEWEAIRLEMGLFKAPEWISSPEDQPEAVHERFLVFAEQARSGLAEVAPDVADEIADMSDDEVAVRYVLAKYAPLVDGYVSILYLPPHQGIPLLDEADRRLDAEPEEVARHISAVSGVYLRVWELRRRLAALRVVESLRDHAARHGSWPASLDEAGLLPIPEDPLTGESFEYTVNADGTAVLTGRAIELESSRFEPDELTYQLQLRAE